MRQRIRSTWLSRRPRFRRSGEAAMMRYDFEIVQGGATRTVERNVAIADEKTLWTRIGALADRIPQSGGFVKVTDEVGAIVALVGAATATVLCGGRASPP